MGSITVGIAQMNSTVGDLRGNLSRIASFIRRAEEEGTDLLCFPELALTGYPPEDLALNRDFVEENIRVLEEAASLSGETVVLLGFIDLDEDCFNSAAVIHRGEVKRVYHKSFLPNYGVFDENRYFSPGRRNLVLEYKGIRIGVTICEDIWFPGGPLEEEVAYGGAEVVVNLSASPFYRGKQLERERLVQSRAQDGQVIVVYANAVGAQDELVFDGRSFVYHPHQGMLVRGPGFEEAFISMEVETGTIKAKRGLRPLHRYLRQGGVLRPTEVVPISGQGSQEGRSSPCSQSILPHDFMGGARPAPPRDFRGRSEAEPDDPMDEIYKALILGLRDYFRKNGMEEALVGISGGVDSALVAALAVEALGSSKVHGLFMPSRYTSSLSFDCAQELRKLLGFDLVHHNIDGLVETYLDALPFLREGGVALENLQARIRGNLLMAYSNLYGWLVLSTGNKSELSMGYCTLYGDMAGGFALIKDLFKRDVYALALYLNRIHEHPVIPQAILDRPPSAELREDQLDTDSLPPYDLLDAVLEAYVEGGLRVADIARLGFPEETVWEIVSRVELNEYKRRQAPVGVKITPRAFGRDWRMPISNAFFKNL